MTVQCRLHERLGLLVTQKYPHAVRSTASDSLWPQLTDCNPCPISEHTGSLCALFSLSLCASSVSPDLGFREPEDRAHSDRGRKQDGEEEEAISEGERHMIFKISDYHTLGWIAYVHIYLG